MSTLRESLEALLPRVSGLVAVHVTDRDGVVLESVSTDPQQQQPQPTGAEQFAGAAEMAGKMGFGRTRTITALCGDRALVHVNASPLVVVTFVLAGRDANVGMVHAICPDLVRAMQPFVAAVEAVASAQ